MRTFLNHIKNETLDEIKTSLENLWQRMIQLSEFFQYSFVLILKWKCLVGSSQVWCGESGTPSTIIYTQWSSRRYELGCDAPVGMRHVLQLAGITLLWLVDLSTDWDCLVPHCIMGSRDQWEFPLFFRPQWQSFCTAVMAGNCLLFGLCKGTVRESMNHDTLAVNDARNGQSMGSLLQMSLSLKWLQFLLKGISKMTFTNWLWCLRWICWTKCGDILAHGLTKIRKSAKKIIMVLIFGLLWSIHNLHFIQ